MRFGLKPGLPVMLAFAGFLLLPVLPARSGPILEYYTEGFFYNVSSPTSLTGTDTNGNDATYAITEGIGYPPLTGTSIPSPYTGSSKIVLTGRDSEVGTLTYNYSGQQTPAVSASGIATNINMGTFTITTDNTAGTSFAGGVFGFDLDIFQIDPSTGNTSLLGTVDGTATDGSSPGDVAIHFSDTPDDDNVTIGSNPGVFYQLLNTVGITTNSTRITTEVFNVANGGTGTDTLLANATVPVALPRVAPAWLVLMGGLIAFTAIRRRGAAKPEMLA
jgi:hypothetical protein